MYICMLKDIVYTYIYIPEKGENESQQPPDERVKRRTHLSNTCLLGRWQAECHQASS